MVCVLSSQVAFLLSVFVSVFSLLFFSLCVCVTALPGETGYVRVRMLGVQSTRHDS